MVKLIDEFFIKKANSNSNNDSDSDPSSNAMQMAKDVSLNIIDDGDGKKLLDDQDENPAKAKDESSAGPTAKKKKPKLKKPKKTSKVDVTMIDDTDINPPTNPDFDPEFN